MLRSVCIKVCVFLRYMGVSIALITERFSLSLDLSLGRLSSLIICVQNKPQESVPWREVSPDQRVPWREVSPEERCPLIKGSPEERCPLIKGSPEERFYYISTYRGDLCNSIQPFAFLHMVCVWCWQIDIGNRSYRWCNQKRSKHFFSVISYFHLL